MITHGSHSIVPCRILHSCWRGVYSNEVPRSGQVTIKLENFGKFGNRMTGDGVGNFQMTNAHQDPT